MIYHAVIIGFDKLKKEKLQEVRIIFDEEKRV